MCEGTEGGRRNIGECGESGVGAGTSRSEVQHPGDGGHASGDTAHEDRNVPTVRSHHHHPRKLFLRGE